MLNVLSVLKKTSRFLAFFFAVLFLLTTINTFFRFTHLYTYFKPSHMRKVLLLHDRESFSPHQQGQLGVDWYQELKGK